MHNAAAGMRAEILAGREIPHATVIAFSRWEGITTTTRTVMPDRFIDRDLFRFLDPFCSVPCQSKIIRVYRYVRRVTPGNQKHEEIYRLAANIRANVRVSMYRLCYRSWQIFVIRNDTMVGLIICVIRTLCCLYYDIYLLKKEKKLKAI